MIKMIQKPIVAYEVYCDSCGKYIGDSSEELYDTFKVICDHCWWYQLKTHEEKD